MLERSLPAGPHHVVRVRCSTRDDGDFRVDGPAEALAMRRRALAPGEWTWLRQVHGATVIDVGARGDGAGREGDASVTSVTHAVLAVQTADCAPLVLAAGATVGIVHAGWRGLVEGVIPATLAHLRRRSSSDIHALLGPCIGPSGYEFGPAELEAVVGVAGPRAAASTADGRPALDLPAAVRAICERHGVASFGVVAADTGASVPYDTAGPEWYSHRTRGDEGRQATVAWLEAVS